MCLKYFKVYNYVDGTGKTIFFVCSRDTPLGALRIEPATDVAVNVRLRCRTSTMYTLNEISEWRECVESRLAARADGDGEQEILDAVGTLLKGSEEFLEIRILLITLFRNSILSSTL